MMTHWIHSIHEDKDTIQKNALLIKLKRKLNTNYRKVKNKKMKNYNSVNRKKALHMVH